MASPSAGVVKLKYVLKFLACPERKKSRMHVFMDVPLTICFVDWDYKNTHGEGVTGVDTSCRLKVLVCATVFG